MAARNRPSSLALLAFSDRELLNIVLDNLDENGWTTTQEIADAIGVRSDNATRCVGTRFA